MVDYKVWLGFRLQVTEKKNSRVQLIDIYFSDFDFNYTLYIFYAPVSKDRGLIVLACLSVFKNFNIGHISFEWLVIRLSRIFMNRICVLSL